MESQNSFTDRGRSNIAMMLYGHGDGGGGPDENMLKRAKRLEDCDGVPKVRHATPEAFFSEVLYQNYYEMIFNSVVSIFQICFNFS